MLTRSQETAFHRIMSWYTTGVSKVFRLGGPAGSGKSYLIKLIAEEVGMSKCLLITPTGKASNNLIKSGLHSHTIHSQIYTASSEDKIKVKGDWDILMDDVMNMSDEEVDKLEKSGELQRREESVRRPTIYDVNNVDYTLNKPETLEKYQLFIIDEGSMVGEKLLADIMSFNKPILLVGDPHQLQPVNDASVFTDCDFYLTDIVRQAQGSPVIWLSQQILQGTIPSGVFGTSQVRHGEATLDELRYADEVLTDTNAARDRLNHKIRPLYISMRELCEPFAIGDKIICRTNQDLKSNAGFVLTNGAQGYLTKLKSVSMDRLVYSIVMSSWELGDFSFRGTQRPELFKRDERPAKIELAYAITVHLSQGSEWDNVIYAVSKKPTRSALYTAVTRAKNSVLVTLPN